jgi:dissimilatory sulfite reductase (desulfoviridin) alpha/beta subunit
LIVVLEAESEEMRRVRESEKGWREILRISIRCTGCLPDTVRMVVMDVGVVGEVVVEVEEEEEEEEEEVGVGKAKLQVNNP